MGVERRRAAFVRAAVAADHPTGRDRRIRAARLGLGDTGDRQPLVVGGGGGRHRRARCRRAASGRHRQHPRRRPVLQRLLLRDARQPRHRLRFLHPEIRGAAQRRDDDRRRSCSCSCEGGGMSFEENVARVIERQTDRFYGKVPRAGRDQRRSARTGAAQGHRAGGARRGAEQLGPALHALCRHARRPVHGADARQRRVDRIRGRRRHAAGLDRLLVGQPRRSRSTSSARPRPSPARCCAPTPG